MEQSSQEELDMRQYKIWYVAGGCMYFTRITARSARSAEEALYDLHPDSQLADIEEVR